jgi:hypothetical protein
MGEYGREGTHQRDDLAPKIGMLGVVSKTQSKLSWR